MFYTTWQMVVSFPVTKNTMRTRWILWIIHAIKLSQNKRIKEPRPIVRHSEHKSRNTTSFESCKFPFFHPSMVVGQGKIKSLAFINTKGHSLIKFHWFYIAVTGWSTLKNKTKQNLLLCWRDGSIRNMLVMQAWRPELDPRIHIKKSGVVVSNLAAMRRKKG